MTTKNPIETKVSLKANNLKAWRDPDGSVTIGDDYTGEHLVSLPPEDQETLRDFLSEILDPEAIIL